MRDWRTLLASLVEQMEPFEAGPDGNDCCWCRRTRDRKIDSWQASQKPEYHDADCEFVIAVAALREPGADTGTTPPIEELISKWSNELVYSLDEAEIDLIEKIAPLILRDMAAAERGTTPPTKGQMKRTAEQVVSEWHSTGSTDWGQLVSAINYWAITDMCPALRGTTPPEGLR